MNDVFERVAAEASRLAHYTTLQHYSLHVDLLFAGGFLRPNWAFKE